MVMITHEQESLLNELDRIIDFNLDQGRRMEKVEVTYKQERKLHAMLNRREHTKDTLLKIAGGEVGLTADSGMLFYRGVRIVSRRPARNPYKRKDTIDIEEKL